MSGPPLLKFSIVIPWPTSSKSLSAKCGAIKCRPHLFLARLILNQFWPPCRPVLLILPKPRTKSDVMPHNNTQSSADWLELVREKVQSLQFGVVQIVVHDSKVTQIERTEKTRLKNDSGSRPE